MQCFLCKLEAKGSESADSVEVNCPDCGQYQISHLVIKQLATRQLEYSKMRDDLHRQRQFNNTLMAEINTQTAIWE
jgi:predicted RNA-binding Zn-ribbon protein involved in translation (DUF1610 family)